MSHIPPDKPPTGLEKLIEETERLQAEEDNARKAKMAPPKSPSALEKAATKARDLLFPKETPKPSSPPPPSRLKHSPPPPAEETEVEFEFKEDDDANRPPK